MSNGRWREVLIWAAVAMIFAVAAAVIEPELVLEVTSWGHKVEVAAAGSTLSVPMQQVVVDEVGLWVSDGIYPPGGRRIEVDIDGSIVVADELPARFVLPVPPWPPVGDWFIDDLQPAYEIWHAALPPGWPVTVRATMRGRFQRGIRVQFEGDPRMTAVVRRGMINNDLLLLDEDDEVVASTSIDPAPGLDLAAASALLLRGGAVAAGLFSLAVFVGAFLLRTRWGSVAWRLPRLNKLSSTLLVAVIVVAAVLRSLWVASDVLDGLPHQPDSVAYILQAGWLLEGRLSGPAPVPADAMDVPYTYVVGDRLVGHYPVLWPAVLAVGKSLARPWMVAPMLAGLYSWLLILLGREAYGDGLAVGAALLSLVSPMAALMFGCQMSHALAATLVVLFLWLFLVARRCGSSRWSMAAAGALAAAFGVRPLTAVAVGAAAVTLILVDVWRDEGHAWNRRQVGAAVVGGVLLLLPTLLANQMITGGWLDFPYSLAGKPMVASAVIPLGLRNFDAILAHAAPAVFGWGWGLVRGWGLTALPVAVILLVVLHRDRRRLDLFLLLVVSAVAGAYVVARASGLHGFGPRYWFEIFACLYLLAARSFQVLAEGAGATAEPRRATLIFPALLAMGLVVSAGVALPFRLIQYEGYNQVGPGLEQAVAESGVESGIIVLSGDQWQDWAEASRLMTADNNGDLIFVRSGEDRPRVLEGYGDRAVYEWSDGVLRPLGLASELPADVVN